ncbi:hypothetical protein Droror1_Dr00011800 [Drosera rotundifolia]
MTQKFTHPLAVMEAEAEGGGEGEKRQRRRRDAAAAWLGTRRRRGWETRRRWCFGTVVRGEAQGWCFGKVVRREAVAMVFWDSGAWGGSGVLGEAAGWLGEVAGWLGEAAAAVLWEGEREVFEVFQLRAGMAEISQLHILDKKLASLKHNPPWAQSQLPSKKTTVKHSNLNPEWNEDFTIIVKDLETQVLELHVFDWEKGKMKVVVEEKVVEQVGLAEAVDERVHGNGCVRFVWIGL